MKFQTVHLNEAVQVHEAEFGDNKINDIEFTKFERDGNLPECFNPVRVDGFVEIENLAKTERVPFTYYRGLLKMDLSMFPFRECEEELIKAKITELCSTSAIDPGTSHANLVYTKWVWRAIYFTAIGALIGWFLTVTIQGC